MGPGWLPLPLLGRRPDACSSHTNAGPAFPLRSWVQSTGQKSNLRLGGQAYGRGSSAVGPERQGKGYSVTVPPRWHCLYCRCPRLVLLRAPSLSGWPGRLRPLREEAVQDSGPQNPAAVEAPSGSAPGHAPSALLRLGSARPPASSRTRPRGTLLLGVRCNPPLKPPIPRGVFAGFVGSQYSQALSARHGGAGSGRSPPRSQRTGTPGIRARRHRPPPARLLSHTARTLRTAAIAVEFGFAKSWALRPMLVHPCRPSPWPPGAWRSAYSKRPPAPCACSTLPNPWCSTAATTSVARASSAVGARRRPTCRVRSAGRPSRSGTCGPTGTWPTWPNWWSSCALSGRRGPEGRWACARNTASPWSCTARRTRCPSAWCATARASTAATACCRWRRRWRGSRWGRVRWEGRVARKRGDQLTKGEKSQRGFLFFPSRKWLSRTCSSQPSFPLCQL